MVIETITTTFCSAAGLLGEANLSDDMSKDLYFDYYLDLSVQILNSLCVEYSNSKVYQHES